MIKLNFTGEAFCRETEKGILEVAPELGIVLDPSGINVSLEHVKEGLKVKKDARGASISFGKRVELFRALGILVQHYEESDFLIEEYNSSHMLGTMVDNSRNAVMTTESVKRLCRYMALMGHNTLMLYTEDTFEIEGYPYFGYMRGRYSAQELQECDEYAQMLGIELVPCIQTLAHLNAALRWNAFSEVHDCNDILLVDEEKTYALIDAMLASMSKNIKSRNIHVGMDEAEMLGLGEYLKRHGFRNRTDIMLRHLERVVELCNKYDYKPMMWSDMFFKLVQSGNYYDGKGIPREILEKVPREVSLVYWDYYNTKPEKPGQMLDRHLEFDNPVVFAGGAWRWRGFAPLNGFSLLNSRVILEQCKNRGVNNYLVTAWGDDGCECSNFTILPVLQLFAEISYAQNSHDEHLSKRLKACTGISLEDFLLLDSPNNVPGNEQPGKCGADPSKYLLYQDVLMGLFDKHVEEKTFSDYYTQASHVLMDAAGRNPAWENHLKSMAHLCDILELKCDMGIRLKKAYDSQNRRALKEIACQIPDLLNRVDVFYEDIRYQWMKENKPFGFDVISIRFGALKMRLEEARRRVEEYLEGTLSRLEELEEERLYYDVKTATNPNVHLEMDRWHHIVTPNSIGHNILS